MAVSNLLTAQDLAVVLRVGVYRVYELSRSNAIPTVRIGRQVRFDRAQVEAWIAGGGNPQGKTISSHSIDACPAPKVGGRS